MVHIHVKENGKGNRMDNLETLTMLNTYDIGRRRKEKQKREGGAT